MRGGFAILATCVSVFAGPADWVKGAGDDCTVRKVDYHGWGCVELSNGRIEVVVAPQLGGRIIQLRLGDAEYLWVNPKLAGRVLSYVTGKVARRTPKKEDLPKWANYGGDKLWPAPQGFKSAEQWPGPPDPAHLGGTVDNGRYTLETLSSGPDLAAVRLTSPADLYAGIRFVREIRLRQAATTVELASTMTNVSNRTVRWGIWQVTQHGGHMGKRGSKPKWDRRKIDVQAWSPVSASTRYPNGYNVMFGPAENPQFKIDTSLVPSTNVKLFRLDYQYLVGKVGLDNSAGWLAVTHKEAGYLYAHTFPAVMNQEHPDNASVEFWASGTGKIALGDETVTMSSTEPVLIESEVLSPFARLEPGRSFSFESQLHLARGTGPVIGVSRAGAEIERVCRCEPGGCAGQIAVFHDGELKVLGARKGGPTLGKVRAGDRVDLAKLAKSAKISGGYFVQLVGRDGKPIGEWEIRRR